MTDEATIKELKESLEHLESRIDDVETQNENLLFDIEH